MRPFKTKVDVIAGDKASPTLNKITGAANRMAKTIAKSAQIAGISFSSFTQKIAGSTKRALVHVNNFGASVNRTVRGIGKKLGTLGALGLGIGFLSIASTIVSANVELDASFASLSAITGKTGVAFEAFKTQVSGVAKEQKLFGGEVAKAFEIVASAKPELLANANALGSVTDAAITLNKASGGDLTQSALSLAGVMNQFSLGAEEAGRVMNALAAGSVAGSANITNVAASMKNFGSVADGANITMEQAVALVEVLGAKSIFAEEAGTKLRGSVLKLQKANLGYASGQFKINDALTELRTKYNSLGSEVKKDAFLVKTFGAENVSTGRILLNSIDQFNDLTKAVTGTNTANTQAAIKANTFENRLEEVTAAFKNSITATDKQSGQMQSLKDALAFVADNMDKIIAGVIIAAKIFAVYKIVTLAASVATWAFNSALLANPITWIIIAIIALIAAIAALIYYWEDIVKWVKESDHWFAKLIRFAIWPLVTLFKILGVVIDWISKKFSQLVEWVKTSDGWFAKLTRAMINSLSKLGEVLKVVWDWIVEFIEGAIQPLLDAFSKLGEVIDFFSGDTQKQLGVSIDKTLTLQQRGLDPNNLTPEQMGISSGTKPSGENKSVLEGLFDPNNEMVKSLNLNSNALADNTKASKKQWTGRFSTTVLKDMNVTNREVSNVNPVSAQKDLAIASMAGQISNSNLQNSILPASQGSSEVVTPTSTSRKSRSENVNGTITVNIVNKTGGKFGLEIDNEGVNVVTTGNS